MALTAGFAFGYAHSQLLVPSDASATLDNILNSKSLLSAEIMAWWFILLLDVIVAWALYHFFKNVSKQVSSLTAWIRVVYSIFLGVAISHLMNVCNLTNETSEISTEAVMIHFQSFENIWSLSLILFGFHLVGLGWLSLKAKIRFWGVLFYIAGFSYTLVHFLKQFPALESLSSNLEMILSIPMSLAEVGFAIWLLIKGRKRQST